MTSNFPGYSRIGGERSEPEWREYSLKRISLFRHVTIPHSTPRLRLVVPIVRIMLKSLANDWAKRRSAATVCVYEIGFDCCLHLKIAKYSSTSGPLLLELVIIITAHWWITTAASLLVVAIGIEALKSTKSLMNRGNPPPSFKVGDFQLSKDVNQFGLYLF